MCKIAGLSQSVFHLTLTKWETPKTRISGLKGTFNSPLFPPCDNNIKTELQEQGKRKEREGKGREKKGRESCNQEGKRRRRNELVAGMV